jgi:hypothetical protein
VSRPAGRRLRRPARGASALAVLAALLLAGCGGGAPAKSTPSPAAPASTPSKPGDVEQLEALIKRRAAAFAAGRPRAYAATATGPQRDRDREVARNARGLPLRDVSLHVDSSDVSGRSARLEVRAVYGVRGIRGTFDTTRRVRARRTPQGWRVRGVSTRRERFPWELGPVQSRRSPHFVVLAPEGLPLDALMSALEAGYARMGEVLKKPRLRRRYLVVVAGGAEAARSLTERIRGVESLAAISDAEVQETGSAKRVSAVVSQRLVVVWPPFSALDGDGQQRVVTHELTHAALAGATSGRTPSWLVEGIALYVSEDRRSGDAARYLAGEADGRARRALSLQALSEPDAIARLSGDGQAVAYAYASAASFYIADRFGRRRFIKLYNAFNDEDLPGKAGLETTRRAIRRTLGISLEQLDTDLHIALLG